MGRTVRRVLAVDFFGFVLLCFWEWRPAVQWPVALLIGVWVGSLGNCWSSTTFWPFAGARSADALAFLAVGEATCTIVCSAVAALQRWVGASATAAFAVFAALDVAVACMSIYSPSQRSVSSDCLPASATEPIARQPPALPQTHFRRTAVADINWALAEIAWLSAAQNAFLITVVPLCCAAVSGNGEESPLFAATMVGNLSAVLGSILAGCCPPQSPGRRATVAVVWHAALAAMAAWTWMQSGSPLLTVLAAGAAFFAIYFEKAALLLALRSCDVDDALSRAGVWMQVGSLLGAVVVFAATNL